MQANTLVSNILQGSTQGHWRFPSNGVEQGYAYLMTHPGTPSVFYDHLEDPQLATTIQRLIALRLRAGIHCRSKVSLSLKPLFRTPLPMTGEALYAQHLRLKSQNADLRKATTRLCPQAWPQDIRAKWAFRI